MKKDFKLIKLITIPCYCPKKSSSIYGFDISSEHSCCNNCNWYDGIEGSGKTKRIKCYFPEASKSLELNSFETEDSKYQLMRLTEKEKEEEGIDYCDKCCFLKKAFNDDKFCANSNRMDLLPCHENTYWVKTKK